MCICIDVWWMFLLDHQPLNCYISADRQVDILPIFSVFHQNKKCLGPNNNNRQTLKGGKAALPAALLKALFISILLSRVNELNVLMHICVLLQIRREAVSPRVRKRQKDAVKSQ